MKPLLPTLAIAAIAATVGVVAAVSLISALGVALLALAACLLFFKSRLGKLFLASLLALLVGYAFLDKAFAYIGAYPIYVSEVVLFLAVVHLIAVHRHVRPTALHWLLAAFMVLGFLRTAPYLEQYGIDALRDGVVWGYGLFAFALAGSLRAGHFRWITRVYAWAIPVFLVWLFLASLVTRFLPVQLPTVLGSDVPVLTLKTGDMGVQLAGIGAFILAGLNLERFTNWKTEVSLWLLWLLNFGIQGAAGRASMLAASTAFAACVFVQPARRTLLRIAVAITIGGIIAVAIPPFEVRNIRALSLDQIGSNILSIVSDDTQGGALEDTKVWRTIWWNEIIDYTFGGSYFWLGKGFGVNLATDDGIPAQTEALRSPHNSHLTVLARMGVPGLGLWLLLQAAFGASLVGSYLRARRHGAMFWCQIDGWLFAYWLALIVNASFDVFFEGPQGGIWFWSIFGLGLAAMGIQRSLFDDADRAQETRLPTPARVRPAFPA